MVYTLAWASAKGGYQEHIYHMEVQAQNGNKNIGVLSNLGLRTYCLALQSIMAHLSMMGRVSFPCKVEEVG